MSTASLILHHRKLHTPTKPRQPYSYVLSCFINLSAEHCHRTSPVTLADGARHFSLDSTGDSALPSSAGPQACAPCAIPRRQIVGLTQRRIGLDGAEHLPRSRPCFIANTNSLINSAAWYPTIVAPRIRSRPGSVSTLMNPCASPSAIARSRSCKVIATYVARDIPRPRFVFD